MHYSFILPTYRRPDVLGLCLAHLAALDYDLSQVEVRVYDNGAPRDSQAVAEPFIGRLRLTYTVNQPGHGLGYSLCRGAREGRGRRVVELNDDALVPPDFLRRLDATFDADPRIGVIGVRAIEDGYAGGNTGIGRIDDWTGEVVGNFDLPTEGPVEVEHVYGFCYAYRREVLERGGGHDEVLLAQDYSSGNRIETDHCLTAHRLGFRVVHDGSIAVRHLAKPRGDMSERSLMWKLNHTRNTLYLYLKHYGLTGRRCLATRFALLMDVGFLSALRRPNKENWLYFLTGLRARASACYHYLRYVTGL